MFQDIKCEPGYVCELQKVECFTEPCYPQPTCVPVKGVLHYISIVPFDSMTKYHVS